MSSRFDASLDNRIRLREHRRRASIGLTPRAARTRLARLAGRGVVREIGTGPQDPKRRYFLAR